MADFSATWSEGSDKGGSLIQGDGSQLRSQKEGVEVKESTEVQSYVEVT